MKVIDLGRCAACGIEFTDDDEVDRYRVSRTPGEWVDEAMHLACHNKQSPFQGGPTFGASTRQPKS